MRAIYNLNGTLLTNEEADLAGVNLRGANLARADLARVNLEGADLAGVNLRGADLTEANLARANLARANLARADLRGADLQKVNLENSCLTWANLVGADLVGADLTGANLRRANLVGADLTGANLQKVSLEGANLRGVAESLGIPVDPTLPEQILRQIETHPDSHDQSVWHNSCNTKHCVAGWATTLSGPLGRFLEQQWGTEVAATLLLWRPGVEMPSFAATATREETLGRLRKMMEHPEPTDTETLPIL